jgi:hypothetical protein
MHVDPVVWLDLTCYITYALYRQSLNHECADGSTFLDVTATLFAGLV